jgi:hypothetical protein
MIYVFCHFDVNFIRLAQILESVTADKEFLQWRYEKTHRRCHLRGEGGKAVITGIAEWT